MEIVSKDSNSSNPWDALSEQIPDALGYYNEPVNPSAQSIQYADSEKVKFSAMERNAHTTSDALTNGKTDLYVSVLESEQTTFLLSNENEGSEDNITEGDKDRLQNNSTDFAENVFQPPTSTGETETHLDDALSELKFGRFQIKILILTCGAYFVACSQMMLIVFLSQPIKEEWSLGNMDFPILPFCGGLTSIVGSYVFGTVSDRYGRQKPLLASIILMTVFGIMASFVPHFWMFVVVKSLVSFGISGVEAIDFVLLLEFLPRKNRGRPMVVITLCGVFGVIFTATLAWVCLPRWGWRWFVGSSTVPAIFLIIYRLVINYESPRYLYISNQSSAGYVVLQEIARQNRTKLSSETIVCPPSAKRGRIRDLFLPHLRWQTCCCTVVWFLQSMGYWSITLYFPEYSAASKLNPHLTGFIAFLAEVPGMLLAIFIVEPKRLGRINSLRMFSLVTIISLLFFAFIKLHGLKIVFAMLVYCFMVPIYSILNTFTPELFPTDMRSMAMAWMYMVISLPALIIPFLGASVLSTNIPWLYPIVGAGFFLLQFIFSFGLKTETAGKDLSDTKRASCRPD